MRPRSKRAYAVLAGLVVGLLVVVGWLTTPSTSGVEGDWEAAAVGGDVLGGRALVARDSAVALDLITGTRITLGSVTGGTRAIGAGRLLVLTDNTLDGAGLDGRSRWTWRGPSDKHLALVAASPSTTVVQTCGGTPAACQLLGIGNNGQQAWETAQPTASGVSAPVVGADGSLPTVGVLRAPDGTLLLVDPTTSRVVLRPAASPSVGVDGALLLHAPNDGQCSTTTYTTLDHSSTTTSAGTCPSAPPGDSAPATGADPTNVAGTRVTPGRARVWWWPFGDGRRTLEVGGRHTGRVVSREPLRALRTDDAGLTVLDGDVVRRYTWVSGG